MGASLLVMVTGLAKSNTNSDTEKAALAGARWALQLLVVTLTTLAVSDVGVAIGLLEAAAALTRLV
ncbi:MAG: hypothetical protein CK533_07700 [Acidobacterium sp.]|nr:hypothetical protein [Acidobacteriota bacterium]PHY10759.1 MAG: hypothetical protein CK533_07700 [Acidobacterium sp.]